MPSPSAKRAPGSRWRFPGHYWFPIAAAYAALILPWSVLGQLGDVAAPPGLASHLGHAHEMLFGFALAVVAGYALTPNRNRQALALVGVWLLARVGSLWWPTSWPTAIFNAVFAAGLAACVAPAYLHAQKWRNRSVAFILAALAAAVLLFHAAALAQIRGVSGKILLEAVLLLSALMFFMGGRILAPAIAGHIGRKGPRLKHVVQGRIEGAALLALAAALASLLAPYVAAHRVGGALLLLAAALTLGRMLRWQPWLCCDKPDLLALLAGYAWLIVGWVLVGLALLLQAAPVAALHAITVGALGTLTYSVMLRTQLFRSRFATDDLPWARLGVIGIAAATLLRITTTGTDPQWKLLVAAALWSACYVALFLLLLRVQPRRKSAPRDQIR